MSDTIILIQKSRKKWKLYIPEKISEQEQFKKDELETLLSWNFQSFKNVKISAI
jgi:hypothetical protein